MECALSISTELWTHPLINNWISSLFLFIFDGDIPKGVQGLLLTLCVVIVGSTPKAVVGGP